MRFWYFSKFLRILQKYCNKNNKIYYNRIINVVLLLRDKRFNSVEEFIVLITVVEKIFFNDFLISWILIVEIYVIHNKKIVIIYKRKTHHRRHTKTIILLLDAKVFSTNILFYASLMGIEFTTFGLKVQCAIPCAYCAIQDGIKSNNNSSVEFFFF